MNSPDTETGIRQIDNAGSRVSPHEMRIFTDADVPETGPLPRNSAVRERVARHPRAAWSLIGVLPGACPVRIPVIQAAGAANVGVTVYQRDHLPRQSVRRVPVVVVPVGDDFSCGQLTCTVALPPQSEPWLAPHITNAGLIGDEVLHGLGTVVEDQQLA